MCGIVGVITNGRGSGGGGGWGAPVFIHAAVQRDAVLISPLDRELSYSSSVILGTLGESIPIVRSFCSISVFFCFFF